MWLNVFLDSILCNESPLQGVQEVKTVAFTYSVGSAKFYTDLGVPDDWDTLPVDEQEELLEEAAYEEVGDNIKVDMDSVKEENE